MTDTTDIKALKINTYSVNSNDAWPQCADDDRTGSYVKWEDLVKLLSDKSQGKDPETGFDSLKNLKFVADCCIEKPDSIYASEFFLLLDEMFGKQGDYLMPVQAVAVSHLIGLLEAERQRADASHKYGNDRDAENESLMLTVGRLRAELAALKGDQVPVAYTAARWLDTRCKLSVWTDRDSAVMEIGDNSKVAELYDRPQKPVVLPQAYGLDCFDQLVERNDEDGFLFYKCEVIDAIKDAGGIVKDGE